jgi:tripartite-type tricarboxylate transporter receptor subunit TctC
MNILKRLAVASALALGSGIALPQDFPIKPIRVIVPYPAGGIVDIVTRAVTEKISTEWRRPILVEPRPGADSNLGTDAVARSSPDGYTWLVTGPAILSNPIIYGNLAWDPVRDFQGIGVLVWTQNIGVVPASLPAKTMKEFVAYAKARAGQLNIGIAGIGSSPHLSSELFMQVAGIQMVSIGYKGQPPAIPDLLSGQLHFQILSLGLALPHVKSGRLAPIATFTPERLKELPDVPTIAEAGYSEAALLPWYGAYVPAATPKAVVVRVNSEINKALQSTDVRDRLFKAGTLPGPVKTPEEIQAMMKNDYARWSKVIRAANIKLQ